MTKNIATISIMTVVAGVTLVSAAFADQQDALSKNAHASDSVTSNTMITDAQHHAENSSEEREGKTYLWWPTFGKCDHDGHCRDHESERHGHGGRHHDRHGGRHHGGHDRGHHGGGHHGGRC